MTKQALDNQLETYRQREETRRHEFIERMEQKLQLKLQVYHEQRVQQVSRIMTSRRASE